MEILNNCTFEMLPTVLRFLINVLSVGLITHCLYFPKSRRRECMTLTPRSGKTLKARAATSCAHASR